MTRGSCWVMGNAFKDQSKKTGLNVTRDQVYDVDADLEGLRQRQPRFKQKKEKGTFTAVGPNSVVSLDGHDKLMGFQKSTSPLAMYGCRDTASRKILGLDFQE